MCMLLSRSYLERRGIYFFDLKTSSGGFRLKRQAVGTFDVCLFRQKVCPTDIVRPHAAQLMIDTSVNQYCKIWPSADWPKVDPLRALCLLTLSRIH